MAAAYKSPGRFGDPSMDLQKDPRANPKLVAALASMGMAGRVHSEYPPNDHATLEPLMAASHEGNLQVFERIPIDLPGDEHGAKVEQSTVKIDGVDGNKIDLHIFRRADAGNEPLPALLYIHGGGMTILTTVNPMHVRWCTSLAQHGLVVVLVDFRNAWYPNGVYYPFPAGLNDCAAAVKYVHTHKSDLHISKIILQGDSGGSNLALATALKANRESWIDQIAGVYACVPYISGAYGWPDERKAKELPSLYEVDGYFLTVPMMAGMAHFYSPNESDMTNPLAWPYHATEKDLKGLPPHNISCDELDPLRDEGIAYYRKLIGAGVEATAQVNLGLTHAASVIFRQALPEVYRKMAREIAAFAKSV